MKVVQILGTAPVNIRKTPDNVASGAERWCGNDPKRYLDIGFRPAIKTWTRWFNIHSHAHMRARHPHALPWYRKQKGHKPIYTRDADLSIPGNVVFPGPMLQDYFGEETFFTHQVAWLMALAIYEKFDRIELWGCTFGHGMMTNRKYDFERPAMHYWIGRARQAGIEVKLPPEARLCYADYLYGYSGPKL